MHSSGPGGHDGGMPGHDNLFDGVAFALPPGDRMEALGRFAGRFGKPAIVRLAAARSGPDEDAFVRIAGRLMTAQIDGLILLSAAGTDSFLKRGESLPDPERFLAALADLPKLAAGPGAQRMLARRGILAPTCVDRLDDWRPLADALGRWGDAAGTCMVLESSRHDLPLLASLESRGIRAETIPLILPGNQQGPWSGSPAGLQSGMQTRPLPTPSGATRFASFAGSSDDLAAIAKWVQTDPQLRSRLDLFCLTGPMQEAAQMTGFRAWPLKLHASPEKWDETLAVEMARRIW